MNCNSTLISDKKCRNPEKLLNINELILLTSEYVSVQAINKFKTFQGRK